MYETEWRSANTVWQNVYFSGCDEREQQQKRRRIERRERSIEIHAHGAALASDERALGPCGHLDLLARLRAGRVCGRGLEELDGRLLLLRDPRPVCAQLVLARQHPARL